MVALKATATTAKFLAGIVNKSIPTLAALAGGISNNSEIALAVGGLGKVLSQSLEQTANISEKISIGIQDLEKSIRENTDEVKKINLSQKENTDEIKKMSEVQLELFKNGGKKSSEELDIIESQREEEKTKKPGIFSRIAKLKDPIMKGFDFLQGFFGNIIKLIIAGGTALAIWAAIPEEDKKRLNDAFSGFLEAFKTYVTETALPAAIEKIKESFFGDWSSTLNTLLIGAAAAFIISPKLTTLIVGKLMGGILGGMAKVSTKGFGSAAKGVKSIRDARKARRAARAKPPKKMETLKPSSKKGKQKKTNKKTKSKNKVKPTKSPSPKPKTSFFQRASEKVKDSVKKAKSGGRSLLGRAGSGFSRAGGQLGKIGSNVAARSRSLIKPLAGAGGKSFLKKIPALGAIAGGAFALNRLSDGDYLGALMEVGSGLASLIPGVGTGVSAAMDVGLIARDISRSNPQQFDEKNIPEEKMGVAKIVRDVAKEHGIPEDYFMNLAMSESSLDPNAKAKTSSARGLFQITKGTENLILKKYNMQRGDIYDPVYNATLAALLTKENMHGLVSSGVNVSKESLHLAHFSGLKSAVDLFGSNMNTPVEEVLSPAQISANPFLKGKTAGEAIQFFAKKQNSDYSAAMSTAPSNRSIELENQTKANMSDSGGRTQVSNTNVTNISQSGGGYDGSPAVGPNRTGGLSQGVVEVMS